MMGDVIQFTQLTRPADAGICRVSDAGMEITLGGGETLWLGEVAAATLALHGVDAADLGGDGGWWIVHFGHTTRVIGKLHDHQGAPNALYESILNLARAMGARA